MNVIEIKSVFFKYQNASMPAINNVSFDVKEGSYSVLAGLNGSGKSTLSKIIAGLIVPEKGEVVFNDKTYILKGKVPTYIMDRCSGKVGKEFQKMVVTHKDESVTITDKEDIEKLEYLFDENQYAGKNDKIGKGWIYRVTATEKDGDEVELYVISTGLIKAPDGNIYEHSNGINVRGIDELTGINRK